MVQPHGLIATPSRNMWSFEIDINKSLKIWTGKFLSYLCWFQNDINDVKMTMTYFHEIGCSGSDCPWEVGIWGRGRHLFHSSNLSKRPSRLMHDQAPSPSVVVAMLTHIFFSLHFNDEIMHDTFLSWKWKKFKLIISTYCKFGKPLPIRSRKEQWNFLITKGIRLQE